jgi:hypothetical protein
MNSFGAHSSLSAIAVHRTSLALQRLQIQHKAILHFAFDYSFPSLFNLVKAGHLNVRDDVVLTAEIKHFLRFFNAADI